MNTFINSVPRSWRERKYKYRLIGGICKKCNATFYPYRGSCPYCGSDDIEEVNLPKKGRLISYTIIYSPPSEFRLKQPYIVGLIELEDGTRIIAQITDVDVNEVKDGIEVEAVFRRYREQGADGIIEYGIKFRPISD
ncbi:MAG: Zn-ribbon domain-containing OB-fold protein [Thermoproteales archaeon]|nr:Zn-ribbon domain-containing OB-fold protein [Thermoproteales archaeon]